MSALKIIAIVAFALAAVLIVLSIVLFFRLGVMDAIHFLQHKEVKKSNRATAKGKSQKRAGRVGNTARTNSGKQKTDRIVTGSAPQPASGRHIDAPVSADDSEQPTELLHEDSEQPTSLLVEESELPTGLLVEESEQPTGLLVEESERPTGLLVEESERPTGLLVDESEQPTGLLVEQSEQPTSVLTTEQPIQRNEAKSAGNNIAQQQEIVFKFNLVVNRVVTHTDEEIA